MEFTKSLILIFTAILIVVSGQLSLKSAMNDVGFVTIDITTNYIEVFKTIFSRPLIYIGLSLYGLGAVIWMVVLSRVDLSLAYPMLSLSYVIIVILSAIIFKENITLFRILGVLFICTGVLFISKS